MEVCASVSEGDDESVGRAIGWPVGASASAAPACDGSTVAAPGNGLSGWARAGTIVAATFMVSSADGPADAVPRSAGVTAGASAAGRGGGNVGGVDNGDVARACGFSFAAALSRTAVSFGEKTMDRVVNLASPARPTPGEGAFDRAAETTMAG
jgi:hypothetical protein